MASPDHVWTELRPAVRALIAHVLRQPANSAEVEDCTSEAICRALEGRARLSDDAPLRPWLLGIARHVALDVLRKRPRAGAPDDDAQQIAALENVCGQEPDAFQELVLSERIQQLRGATRSLPHVQRRAFLLHAQGLEYREIASELEVPIGTVCTWIARARRHLLETARNRISSVPPIR
jgi:RNA polymerase sigma factor (sigma-70 family)